MEFTRKVTFRVSTEHWVLSLRTNIKCWWALVAHHASDPTGSKVNIWLGFTGLGASDGGAFWICTKCSILCVWCSSATGPFLVTILSDYMCTFQPCRAVSTRSKHIDIIRHHFLYIFFDYLFWISYYFRNTRILPDQLRICKICPKLPDDDLSLCNLCCWSCEKSNKG